MIFLLPPPSKILPILSLMLLMAVPSLAQHGIGLKFATNINWFPRPEANNLVEAGFTTGIFGVFYSKYGEFSGFEAGINIEHKGGVNGFSFPGIMEDFSPDQNVGLTGMEIDFKFGPRLWKIFYPRIGMVLGYRWNLEGFQTEGNEDEINPWYMYLPLGGVLRFPTNWGAVGFGGHYYVGILDVLRNPNPNSPDDFIGGRQRAFNIELTATYVFKPGER